jgi:undecaprenyl-diphosphatase
VSVWEALILGIVQGATEFLPVSSSGHLVMTQAVLSIDISGVLFEVAVHLATLLSILVVYRARVADLTRGAMRGDAENLRYIGMIIVATIPAGLLGVLAKDRIEVLFDNPYVPGFALIVTGAILWSSRSALRRATGMQPTWSVAALIGVAQAFALVPGISRSGTTVVVALWLGLEAREAAAFSFLMAVPAIAGAAVLQIPELGDLASLSKTALIVGGVAAAVTGVLAIRTFVAMLGREAFHLFAPYCWLVGSAYLVFLSIR